VLTPPPGFFGPQKYGCISNPGSKTSIVTLTLTLTLVRVAISLVHSETLTFLTTSSQKRTLKEVSDDQLQKLIISSF